MLDEQGAAALTYQVLDELLSTRRISVSSRCGMFAVIDSLRACGAPKDDVQRAENISIQIHNLEQAQRCNDGTAADECLERIRSFAAEVLNARIRVRH